MTEAMTLRCGPDVSGARAVAVLGTGLLELSQKLRCSLKHAMAWKERERTPATFKSSYASMGILVFEIASIHWFQTACVC